MTEYEFFKALPETTKSIILADLNAAQQQRLDSLDEVKDNGVKNILLRNSPVFLKIRDVLYTLAHSKCKGVNETELSGWREYIFHNTPFNSPLNPAIRQRCKNKILAVLKTELNAEAFKKGKM